MHVIVILLILAGAVIAFKWLQNQPSQVRKNAGLKMALGAVGALVVVGVLTGRLNPMALLVTAVAAIPMLTRLLDAKQLFDRLRSSTGPRSQQHSSVSTQFLEMTLDHDSGQMHGRVVSGRFEGRALSELDNAQLLELLHECGADSQSVKLLETYLDRTFGDHWRDAAGGSGGGGSSRMSLEQAREILGVDEGATRERIIAAHRSLMQKIHPDRGGSTYLAAQVNQAKEVLLSSL